jgi:hypothetical protein
MERKDRKEVHHNHHLDTLYKSFKKENDEENQN